MGMVTQMRVVKMLGRQVLLASIQAGVVHDAIVFLTTCRWVRLPGLGWPWSVHH